MRAMEETPTTGRKMSKRSANPGEIPDGGASKAIERWPLERFKRYGRNSRTHSPSQIEQIAASMERFGFTVPILVRGETGEIAAGHGRLAAAELLRERGVPGFDAAPVIVKTGWSDAEFRAYVIADNKIAEEAGWDEALLRLELGELREEGFDISVTGFDASFLDGIAEDLKGSKVSLADLFGVPPFTVLSAREGWWQDRKRAWLALGIRSEVGRGEDGKSGRTFGQDMLEGEGIAPQTGLRTSVRKGREAAEAKTNGGVLMPSHTSGDPGFYAKKRATEKKIGRELTTDEFLRDHYVPDDAPTASGTSIFDPVLCELAYRWFAPPGGSVFDPFAGGSVRGVVAGKLGRQYVGVDLRPEQVAANEEQAVEIFGEAAGAPVWVCGDSRDAREIGKTIGGDGPWVDFVFSCPPYADLEVYSDDPRDLSRLDYADFRKAYREIIAASCSLLRPDRFACFVVGDVRDSRGAYYGFPWHTIEAFEAAGLRLYNEAVLVTAAGSLPIRARRQFETSRKMGKTHQNVLVFVKGDPKKATEAIGAVEFGAIEPEDGDEFRIVGGGGDE